MAASEELARCVRRYLDLLLLWNQKINLTSLKQPEEILRRHFGESMFAAHAVPIARGRLADVGTGAGFPGLALKLVCPGLGVELIEPNTKKTVFLAEVQRALNLEDVLIVRKRIEEVEVSAPFADFVTSRAVGQAERVVSWARQALRRGGRLVLWLGADDAQRISTFGGWSWRKPIPIPRSAGRVLLVGSVASD